MSDPVSTGANGRASGGLEPLLADSPVEALPELDGLVERMMLGHGYPVEEEAAREPGATEDEVVKEFLEARRIARLVDAGERVGPSDVGGAIAGYRNVVDALSDRSIAQVLLASSRRLGNKVRPASSPRRSYRGRARVSVPGP